MTMRERGARRMTPAACSSLSRAARMLLGMRGRPAASSPLRRGPTSRSRTMSIAQRSPRSSRARVTPSYWPYSRGAIGTAPSALLTREGLGALLGGDRVHPAEVDDVAVGGGERPLVHEAVGRGLARLDATRRDTGGHRDVDGLPALEEDRGRRGGVHRRVADRQRGHGLEELPRLDHEVVVAVLDDDAGRVVVRELRIDGESDGRVEGL